MHVRPARPEDRQRLLELWERAVRATHTFLAESDLVALRPLVAAELAGDKVDWWVLVSATETPVGFLGYSRDTIEALFVDPDHHRQGGGRLLVAHAQTLAAGVLAVDVNEQNESALRFYQALGFFVTGRSPTDGAGRPFPLLHMKRATPLSLRPPLVYLPGAGGLASFWRPVAERLRPRSEPLLVQYPGFGETPPNPTIRSVSSLVDLLVTQLPTSFDLAAQSMGGAVALRLALDHPARVRRLVLVATTGGIDVRRLGAAEWRTSDWVAQRPEMPRWFVDDRSDFGDRLPTIQAPTLVLMGDVDPLAPTRVGEYLRDQIPGASLEIVQGGTHAMAEELPERIAVLIDRHLA